MSTEWKPGDVAMATWRDGRTEVIYRFLGGDRYDIPEWQTPTNGCGYPIDDQLRPLVVIDPEDREDVERLAQEYRNAFWDEHEAPDPVQHDHIVALQAALREFANPTPRFEEPKGEWAVVMDADGNVWTRMNDVHWSSEASPNNRQTWGEIDAVRVLSEGVRDE